MDVQMAVQVAPENLTTSAQMDDGAKVSQYKSDLSQSRSLLVDLVMQRNAASGVLQQLLGARQDTTALFQSEAEGLYPDLKGQDALSNALSQPDGHPLKTLLLKYSQTFTNFDDQIAVVYGDIKGFDVSIAQAQSLFTGLVSDYTAFAKSASMPVPSADDLIADIANNEALPTVNDDSVEAQLKSLAFIDTNAQGIITQEMAIQAQDEADKNSAQAQSFVADSDVTASSVVENLYPAAAPAIKLWPLAVALAALAFVFLGDGDSKKVEGAT